MRVKQEEADLKKIRRKRATFAPYLLCARLGSLSRTGSGEGKIKKIRSKCATSAPYLAEHTQEEEKPEKNTEQTRHECLTWHPGIHQARKLPAGWSLQSPWRYQPHLPTQPGRAGTRRDCRLHRQSRPIRRLRRPSIWRQSHHRRPRKSQSGQGGRHAGYGSRSNLSWRHLRRVQAAL